MIRYEVVPDESTGEPVMEVSVTGDALLNDHMLNKGSAFTEEERRDLGLLGLLPPHISSIEEQLERNYENYKRKETDLERYIFLSALQDRNETLFYKLVGRHITEMMPIIYTPVVGLACQSYSHIYRRPRGLYLSYPQRSELDSILDNAPYANVDVIVVTDGERILGLGDLGVGGMGIPVGKLALYTLCAGVHPATALPILLDVGTDNEELLNDPLYIGWRHRRVRGQQYDDFIEAFISAVTRKFPGVLLQWEDFSKDNASRLLERYRDRLCSFNDDIQGTGAVTLAGLLAAAGVTASKISRQRVVIFGAGSSASGITDQIVTAMRAEGLTGAEATEAIWLVDSKGLVHLDHSNLDSFKRKYAKTAEAVFGWQIKDIDHISLKEVIRHVRPTVLIGTSAQPGAFTEEIVREMAAHTERPIIFPLSNPTSRSEASPADLIAWTEGRALVAAGSPFPPVFYNGREIHIGQCNNAYIFPGVGLGVIASRARRVTNEMFVAAARALSELSPALSDPAASLFPALKDVREVSRRVAYKVVAEAYNSGLTQGESLGELEGRVESCMWVPRYVRLRRKAKKRAEDEG